MRTYDFVVIGGGFYGCCLALFLRSSGASVCLMEAGDALLGRASRVNQARVHTGFHYPRSALTAVKSMVLHQRFAEDFPEAVVDDFEMIYAISRRNSKVCAGRFHRMFREMGAPIQAADTSISAKFDPQMIEQAFLCREVAFDYSCLRETLERRLWEEGVAVRMGCRVSGIEERGDGLVVTCGSGETCTGSRVFNVTYAELNTILKKADLTPADLKYELAEVVLVRPPDSLGGMGVTVMDGPFFSCMPYPARGLYSLTHVRYTPHGSWETGEVDPGFHGRVLASPRRSNAAYMVRDSGRYMPSLRGCEVVDTMFEIKTVLKKNEADDGRPIMFRRDGREGRLISIMGGKIDNIYDLFEIAKREIPGLEKAREASICRKG